ncbi:MAG: SRPBCC family protein [Acidobacteriota bacterium]
MVQFEIDPDIQKARTLPAEFYTQPHYLELSKERIFARTWQFAGIKSEVDGLHPFDLLPDFLNVPLLLSEDEEQLKCLSNVCTHRGKILVERPCRADVIRCGYHGRSFDLSGKFLSMPEFADVQDFPSKSDDLPSLPLSEWAGLLFTSIDPAASFEAFSGGSGFEDQIQLPAPASKRTYEFDAHWALYCENYLEGFHIPFVHRSLNKVIDFNTYKTETYRFSIVQLGFDRNGQIAGKYIFIFPNLMLNFYYWGMSLNVVRPLREDRTAVDFLTFITEKSQLVNGADADLHLVELEDEAVVESVQKGVRSRFYDRGRYSPTREQGTHHFHRLIAEFMSDNTKIEN